MRAPVDTLIKHKVPLPNTLALHASAHRALFAVSVTGLRSVLAANRRAPLLVLGSGSNVVLPELVGGLTILMRIKGIQEKQQASALSRIFEVGGGESWQGFVRFCIGQGLGGGIENLTLIPGTVGAAPIQNIGAYGVEVAEFIQAVQVLDINKPAAPPVWLSQRDCLFGYRDSLFKQQTNRWVVTRVRFELPAGGAAKCRVDYSGVGEELKRMGIVRITPAAVSEAIARLRRSKLPDPRSHPNAGSFFKNPLLTQEHYKQLLRSLSSTKAEALTAVPNWRQEGGLKLAAAALIERAGFKLQPGKGVRVWHRQPLVLVNYAGAGVTEVNAYAELIRDTVHQQFGILLEQEPVQVEADQSQS